MKNLCSESQGLSRRSFLRTAGVALPALSSLGILSESHFAFAAQQGAPKQPTSQLEMMKMMMASIPKDAVLINANENPLGPCDAALAAIAAAARTGGRYDATGVPGRTHRPARRPSSASPPTTSPSTPAPPSRCSSPSWPSPRPPAPTSPPTPPTRPAATPPQPIGAKVLKVPLTSHLRPRRQGHGRRRSPTPASSTSATPTTPPAPSPPRRTSSGPSTTSPRAPSSWSTKPTSTSPTRPSVIDQVNAGKDVIVLRTFSKIYGMAGIRCGFAIGRPDLLGKLTPTARTRMPVTGIAAAAPASRQPDLVPTRRKTHRRHPQRHLRLARRQRLQVHPLGSPTAS